MTRRRKALVGAGVDAVLERLREAVTGSGLRRDKIDGIGEVVRAAENADRKWMEVLRELEGLAGYDPEESGERTCRPVRC